MIYDYFRKDNIVFALCICITITGSLVIIIKKIISRQSIQRIPKSNILPQPTNDQEQSFQMATFQYTPRIIQVQPISEYNEINTGDLFLLRQNTDTSSFFSKREFF